MFTDAISFFHSLRRLLSRLSMISCSALLALALAESAQAQPTWVERGPGMTTGGQVEGIDQRPVAGAIKSVAPHPTDAATIYIGAVNGGIWKTTNATTANPSWVEQLGINRPLSIGAIEFDPTDPTYQTLIAGAGLSSSFAARGNDRVGVWRTTDGGAQWTLLNGNGVITGLNITGVAPRGATLVVSADSANPGASPGIWRSTNTGATWTRVSSAAGTGLPAGASYDLASDPLNDARLFTNAGTNGIYRSLDKGATWIKVNNAAMDAILSAGIANVKISVGASNNVYVAIVDRRPRGAGALAGLFRSGDGGTTWTALDLPTTTESGQVVGIHPGEQGSTHLSIAAHRTNAFVVFIGGDRQPFLNEFTTGRCPCFPNSIGANNYSARLFEVDASRPTGKQSSHVTHSNTTSGSSPHGDSRDMVMDAAGNLIEVDDGGIYKRTNPLGNVGDWFSLIGNLKITEFYAIAWDSNSRIVIGGTQDTGTPQQSAAESFRWDSVETADGGDVAVNDTGTPGVSVRFSSSQYLGNFQRQTYDANNNFRTQVYIPLTPVGSSSPVPQFFTPIELNNVNPNRLVIGAANAVYESTDEGDTVTAINPRIVANSFGQHTMAYGARGNADMLYVGSGDRVYVRAAPAPSSLRASSTYPGAGTRREVEGVAINSTNPQNAWVVDERNVYRTDDAGASWTNITGNLLTLAPGTLRSIAFSTSNPDGSVIVGSENGVFIAQGHAFTTWVPLGTGLPRVPVYDLYYNPVDQTLVAGLLGRGAWTINLRELAPANPYMVPNASRFSGKNRLQSTIQPWQFPSAELAPAAKSKSLKEFDFRL